MLFWRVAIDAVSQFDPLSPLRIVTIGGGTGLSTLLRGLKLYAQGREEPGREQPSVDLTAVVTVTDDGGSSGRLRREFDVLPPGDIRNCMVALSGDEAFLSRLFNYRFDAGHGLKGHSFGNLFLTALTDLTGDFAHAVRLSSEILASRGHIFPSTSANVALEATLENGRVIVGETKISKSRSPIKKVRLKPNRCRPLQSTLDALASADLITLGPGSLYTSVIPNILVEGIPEAIEKSPALKAYFVNLMWQPGETIGLTAAEHVSAVCRHARRRRVLDVVVVNTSPVRPALLKKYAVEQARPVLNDIDRVQATGFEVVGAPLAQERDVVRHDPHAAAAIAVELAERGRAARLTAAMTRSAV
jgi:uncharacterized cofD-like protein